MEERLRKFAHLVDIGGFTKASTVLHVSQPALSMAISKLERELHAVLLVRGSRIMTLTAAGKIAYSAGKEIIVSTSNLAQELAELSHEQPSVSIGMIDSVASAFFSSEVSVDALERQAKVSVMVNNSRFLLQAVKNNTLDIAFIAKQHSTIPDTIKATHVANEPLVVVCHPAQAKSVNKALRTGNIARFISYDQPSNTYQLINDKFSALHIQTVISFFSTSPEMMLRLVLLKKGVAALPYLLVSQLIAVGELTLVGNPDPLIIERELTLIRQRGKLLTPPLTDTSKQVQQLFNGYYNEVITL